MGKSQGGISREEWRQLHVEARALLQPMSAQEPSEDVRKLRAAIGRSLGSAEKVDHALNFMRERRPLVESGETDEMILQIEVCDLFGDVGLLVLPLLERCIGLECRMLTLQAPDDHLEKSGGSALSPTDDILFLSGSLQLNLDSFR